MRYGVLFYGAMGLILLLTFLRFGVFFYEATRRSRPVHFFLVKWKGIPITYVDLDRCLSRNLDVFLYSELTPEKRAKKGIHLSFNKAFVRIAPFGRFGR